MFLFASPPLLGGRVAPVVVAPHAIDHGAIVAGMPNLAGADFEFIGSNDVDNPGVPNMIRSGLGEWSASVFGHGFITPPDGALFVALPVTVSELVQDNLPVQDPPHVRIPREKLLDVFTTSETPALEAALTAQGYPLCEQIVHQNHDRGYASLYDAKALTSMKRRVLARLPDGRILLLRTRTSRVDFETGAPSPGSVP
jgi:hypothetical protein